MSMAVKNGHKDIVQLLLARNDINVNERGPESSWDREPGVGALSAAVKKGHKKLIELLLSRNDIDVNAGKFLGLSADQQYKNIV